MAVRKEAAAGPPLNFVKVCGGPAAAIYLNGHSTTSRYADSPEFTIAQFRRATLFQAAPTNSARPPP
jgi:hypothetical protein